MTDHFFTLARTTQDFAIAAQLFEEYAASLEIDLTFQDFERELKTIAQIYSQPNGALLILSDQHGQVMGCAGIRALNPPIGELKRMYIRPQFQGQGLGTPLLREAIRAARLLGFERLRLDTLPTMLRAIQLYEKHGFNDIQSYRHNPHAGTRYLELDLRTES